MASSTLPAMSLAERTTDWLPLLWYLLAVLVLAYLVLSGAVESLLRRITKFGGFGLEFNFDEQSATQTRETIESGLESVRKTIKRELEADVRARGLQEALATILKSTSLGQSGVSYRATLHIEDPLYANQLYQLLDYYPKGGGHGRSFASRQGIIGLAWRTLEIHSWHQEEGFTEADLVRMWGMTHKSASTRVVADSTKFFLAFPVYDSTSTIAVGVFYIDSQEDPNDLLPKSPTAEAIADTDAAIGKDPREKEHDVSDEVKEIRARARTLAAEVTGEFHTRMAKPVAELVETAKRRSPQLTLESQ